VAVSVERPEADGQWPPVDREPVPLRRRARDRDRGRNDLAPNVVPVEDADAQ